MKRFSIFKKSSKFYWSNNRIIYPIFFTCLLILFIKNGSGIIEKNTLNNTLLGIMLITFICGMILRLIGIPKAEPLQGEIDGFLTFEMNPDRSDIENSSCVASADLQSVPFTSD